MFIEWTFSVDAFLALVLYAIYAAGAGIGLVVLVRERNRRRWAGLPLVGLGLAAIASQTWMSSRYWIERHQIIAVPLRPLAVTVAGVLVPAGLGIGFAVALYYGLVREINSSTWFVRLGSVLVLLLAIAIVGPLVLVAMSQSAQPKPYESDTSTNVRVEPGFKLELFYRGVLNLPTCLRFGPDDQLFVSNYNGEIWTIPLVKGTAGTPKLFAEGFSEPVGLAWNGNDLYVASRGKVTLVRDGNISKRQDIITNLPSRIYPWHSNEGMAIGPDERLYFAVGSTTDAAPETHEYAARVLSASLDGSDLRVFATGVRNPYALAFNSAGDLFATDNGPDNFTNTPGDELNQIVKDGDYGFPKYFGIPPLGTGTRAPVALFPPHASADGITFYNANQFPPVYRDNAFVVMWHLGEVYRIQLNKTSNGDYLARTTLFATGLNHPLDLTVGPDGALYIASWGDNAVYRLSYDSQNLH